MKQKYYKKIWVGILFTIIALLLEPLLSSVAPMYLTQKALGMLLCLSLFMAITGGTLVGIGIAEFIDD